MNNVLVIKLQLLIMQVASVSETNHPQVSGGSIPEIFTMLWVLGGSMREIVYFQGVQAMTSAL